MGTKRVLQERKRGVSSPWEWAQGSAVASIAVTTWRVLTALVLDAPLPLSGLIRSLVPIETLERVNGDCEALRSVSREGKVGKTVDALKGRGPRAGRTQRHIFEMLK